MTQYIHHLLLELKMSDHKRGEIMELRAHLQNRKLDKDPKAKRDVIKKVIAYMTLGIDVSSLFSQMIMAINTHDLVQKRWYIYIYVPMQHLNQI